MDAWDAWECRVRGRQTSCALLCETRPPTEGRVRVSERGGRGEGGRGRGRDRERERERGVGSGREREEGRGCLHRSQMRHLPASHDSRHSRRNRSPAAPASPSARHATCSLPPRRARVRHTCELMPRRSPLPWPCSPPPANAAGGRAKPQRATPQEGDRWGRGLGGKGDKRLREGGVKGGGGGGGRDRGRGDVRQEAGGGEEGGRREGGREEGGMEVRRRGRVREGTCTGRRRRFGGGGGGTPRGPAGRRSPRCGLPPACARACP